jgi:hypothetical protein
MKNISKLLKIPRKKILKALVKKIQEEKSNFAFLKRRRRKIKLCFLKS